MPIISVDAARLNALMDREYAPEVLGDALERIGCDVEEIVELARYRCPNCAALVEGSMGAETVKVCSVCGHAEEAGFRQVDTVTAVRIDLLAARPDLFDIGGLARALKGYLGEVRGLPRYEVRPSTYKVVVRSGVENPEHYRPHIVCAVVEVPPLDDAMLATIMKMQENLHWGVGRDRKLASIGVYDLDTIKMPVRYQTTWPDETSFTPLGMPGRTMSPREVLESHPKGVAYAGLLEGHSRYPVLVDDDGQVLSMPPIINSEGTKVQPGSTRLFIDVTGPSQAAVTASLDMMVSSLAELGGVISAVTIVRPDGTEVVTPDLTPRSAEVSLSRAKQWLGLPLDHQSLVDCFERMRLDAEAIDDDRYRVTYPAFRGDIRHMVDLLEDVAIGFGYENIVPALVPTMTVGRPRPEEVISEQARGVLFGLGFTEVMSLPMTTEADHYEKLRLPVPERYVRVANPKLKALTVVRSHLLGGVANALHANRRRPMPVRLFEMDNCVDFGDGPFGVVEARRLCFAEIGPDAGFAGARSVLDALAFELGWEATYEATEHPSFVPGRVARFTAGAVEGLCGELHPAVLDGFGLDQPVGIVELRLAVIDFEKA
ncbi:MAG: phenylalanine--tRNA ligase subunit beta [Myxococcales bacterium]|nr:phenylalanine--tRNA ligase subunit beta [Myxococcales bacterium]MCB9543007.1 phenylalanine--tRNA ligase subunit beta [Myxococcales bacterium]